MTTMSTPETIKHLGGLNRLRAMIKARDFFKTDSNSMRFRFSGSRKWNVAEITLSGNDTYMIELWKVTSGTVNRGPSMFNIYADQLATAFTVLSGLDLALAAA